MTDAPEKKPPRGGNLGLTAALCAVFVAAMVGASFAAVPLYKILCTATGYAGTTRQAEKGPDQTIDRYVTVRFDTNVANELGWSFVPLQREVRVKVGEVTEVKFHAENRSSVTNTGLASFNVMPGEVGVYFNKISCFCFSTQTLRAGEAVDWPVVFFIDPAIAKDADQAGVDTITLSYTFFPAAGAAAPKPVAEGPAAKAERPL